MSDFKVTHVLTILRHGRRASYYSVMEFEGGLYTRQEWETATACDYAINDHGDVEFQGEPIGYELCPVEEAETIQEKIYASNSLEELLKAIQEAEEDCDTAGSHLEDVVDMTDLPVFGGEVVEQEGVFSWDEDRLLVQNQTWEIVER